MQGIKELDKRNGIGRGKMYRGEGGQKPFSVGGLLVRFAPAPLADCVNSSPPLILRKFQGFGGIRANSRKFGKFQENSGEFSGIQWGFVWRLV